MDVPAQFDVRDHLDGIGPFYAGTANVVMQLARPGVGRGVVESTVESGQVTRHPVKRARTTLAYLAVAMLGSDLERRRFREAVDQQHAAVRSGSHSPVGYNAFDPELQLWVAACLYYGTVDVLTRLHGPLDEATADALYAHAARFAATLEVPARMWPADRAAFAAYWQRSLELVSIDDTVRAYLHRLLDLRHLPGPLRLGARFHRLVNVGFLPEPFRAQMGLPWAARDQRRFDRVVRVTGTVYRGLPRPLRNAPFNLVLADLRLRLRLGRPLV